MRGWVIVAGATCSFAAFFAGACGTSDDGPSASFDAGADAIAQPDAPTQGTDARVPPPVPAGPIDPSAAARAALFIASCTSDDGVTRTLQEIYLERTTSPFRSPAVLACLATKANGCAAMTECIGVRYSNDGPCDAGCVGEVWNECSGPTFRLSVDCTRTGLSCKAARGGYCGGPDAIACDPGTFQGSCDDGTPVGCEDGLTRRGLHCPDFGATCSLLYTTSPGGGSTFGCKGTEGACTSNSPNDTMTAHWDGQRCEGGKLVGCLGSGLSTLDCATSAVGFSCFAAPDAGAGSSAYCGTAAECVATRFTTTCEGTAVVMCNGGKIEKVDCLSLGFTGCTAGLCTPGFL